MFTRAIRLVLIISIAVGGWIAIRQGQVFRTLYAEKMRLTNIVGYMPIEDPSKIYVKRIATDAPGKFAWRIYLPADYAEEERYRTQSGGGGSQSVSLPVLAREEIVRINFRIVNDRRLDVFAQQERTSRYFSLDVPQGLDLTSEALFKLIIDSGVEDFQVHSYNTDQVVYLLNVAWPNKYAKKFEESSPLRMYLNAPILEYGFGSTEAWRIQDEVVQRNN